MVSSQRNVGAQRLPDRFAVVPGFGQRQRLPVLIDAISDLVQAGKVIQVASAAGNAVMSPIKGTSIESDEALAKILGREKRLN